MKYAIVFSSMTGNTRLLADTIRDILPAEDCVYFGAPAREALEADRIYAGFWTNKGCCDEDTAAFLKTLTSQEVFLFGSAGFGGSQEYFDKIIAESCEYIGGDAKLAGTFICQGKMQMKVRERYVKLQQEGAEIPNIQEMIDNFDRALSHPDSDDLDALKKAVLEVK